MNFEKGRRKRLDTASKLFLALLFTGVLFLAGQTTCHATTVVLQWDTANDPSVTGYKVYYQADSSTQPFTSAGATQGASPVDIHNVNSATISGLDPTHAYFFAVTAYSATGESAYSNIVAVPELTSPTVSLSNPAGNATVSGTVSVSASASDNVAVTKVEFYVNGVLQATDTSTPYVYSWNTAAYAAGTNTLMAKAYDAAGNVGQSANATVTVVNDTSAPTVSVTAPNNNATVSGSVNVTANASDDVGVSKVEFYANGTLLSATNLSPYSYTWNTTLVGNGNYTLIAKAYDSVGNVGLSSNVSVTVFNDTTAPTVTAFTMPATASSTTVLISSFTATDNASVAGYMITESATVPAVNATGWSASAPATFTFSAAGSKTAYAWAKDAAGNVSASRSASVAITLPDTIAPTVTITSPDNSATVSGTVIVTAIASDNVGIAKVELYIKGVLTKTDTASPFSFTWDTTSIANGSYSLSIKAYDATGNSTTSAVTVTISNKKSLIKKRGDLNGDGKINLDDALLALRLSVGLTPQTVNSMETGATDDGLDGDVAPLDSSGTPLGDGLVNISDALALLQYSVGLASW